MEIKERIVENPNRRKITKEDGSQIIVDVTRHEGQVTQQGHLITPEKLLEMGGAYVVDDEMLGGETASVIKAPSQRSTKGFVEKYVGSAVTKIEQRRTMTIVSATLVLPAGSQSSPRTAEIIIPYPEGMHHHNCRAIEIANGGSQWVVLSQAVRQAVGLRLRFWNWQTASQTIDIWVTFMRIN